MKLTHVAWAVLMVMIWGINFVAIRFGISEMSPLTLACFRFFFTSIPWIFFVPLPAVPLKFVVIYGLILFALQFTLLFAGMAAGVAPGLASLLMQTQVFFSSLLAVLVFNEKLKSWQIIGACVAFSGIAWVAVHLSGSITTGGFLLILMAAFSWGVGNMLVKHIGRIDGKINMVALIIWGNFFALPPVLLLSLIIDGPQTIIYSLQNISWSTGCALLYITYASTILGFGIWNWLLHRYPVGVVAPFTLLVPIFGIFSSFLVFSESFEDWKILAAVLVISGLCINLGGERLFYKIKKYCGN